MAPRGGRGRQPFNGYGLQVLWDGATWGAAGMPAIGGQPLSSIKKHIAYKGSPLAVGIIGRLREKTIDILACFFRVGQILIKR